MSPGEATVHTVDRGLVGAVCAAAVERGSIFSPEAVARWRTWAPTEAVRIDPVVAGAFLKAVNSEPDRPIT